MEIKISKQLQNKALESQRIGKAKLSSVDASVKSISRKITEGSSEEFASKERPGRWRFLYAFVAFFLLFALMAMSVIKLQVVEGEEYAARSVNNQLRIRTLYPNRGVILDRNGVKVAENVASYNVFVTSEKYYNKNKDKVDEEKLRSAAEKLQALLGDKWQEKVLKYGEDYKSVYDKIAEYLHKYGAYMEAIIIATDIDDQTAINVKAASNDLQGIYVDDSTKREYPMKDVFAHVLGYTSKVSAEDLVEKDYIDANDFIGKSGVEMTYDKDLIGSKGQTAVEVDARFNVASDLSKEIAKPVSGKTLVLTIDSTMQQKMYDALKQYVDKQNAGGAAGILENIKTGEILAIGSYPSYDNNMFVGGISQSEYDVLLNDPKLPLFNRAITSQQPPGSIFKTLVASSALDAGALSTSTVYTSTSNYAFSNGARFPDYRNNAYGPMTVIQGLEYSSNIFFCETIRHWDMDSLVPYLDKFGIGKLSGIDIPGEADGRLPSPENKIWLAKNGATWLDAIWYPEGDSCNSVIGQGITLVTPIQAANWAAAIANGGTLQHPHVAQKLVAADGSEEVLKFEPLVTNIVSDNALATVRAGMRQAVLGPKRFIWPLDWPKYQVAAKTGTAEFGRLNANGEYEHTHAWVIGFYPYDDPQYSFAFFIEDGGSSSNAAQAARAFFDAL